VRAGQAVIAHGGKWVRYGSPEADGAEHVAVSLPVFAPDPVHRDARHVTPRAGYGCATAAPS
jgi:hypothetical protein